MPGKRSFIALCIVYIGLMAYGYHDINAPHSENDGPGYVMGVILFDFMCYGVVTGIFIKVITLYMASEGVSFARRLLTQFIYLMCIPLLYYVLTIVHNF